jgi:hypothetical protein
MVAPTGRQRNPIPLALLDPEVAQPHNTSRDHHPSPHVDGLGLSCEAAPRNDTQDYDSRWELDQ